MSNKLCLIAGPCVIESRENILETAKELKRISDLLDIDIIFKSSFDKANRTSVDAYRGPGIDKGLEILNEVKEKYNMKILTDVHEPWQANRVKDVADILQIPAFLCRQTDLVLAIGETGKTVNIKKGQFLAPWDVKNVIEKVESTGNKNILITERGTSFGYNRLVVDYAGILELKKLGYPVIFDATHSVQLPGGLGGATGGNREYVYSLAKAAISVGVNGLFMETHISPDSAKSDGANMIKLSNMEEYLRRFIKINEAINIIENRG